MPIPNGSGVEGKLFKIVEKPKALLPILESRLPLSCLLVNQLLAYDAFKDKFTAYTFEDPGDKAECNSGSETGATNGHRATENGKPASKLWILFNYKREDWHNCITISSPSPNSKTISAPLKHALEHSKIFDWNDKFVLLNLDPNVANYLIKLNIRTLGNVIKIFPTFLFYMSPEDAAKVDVPEDPTFTTGPMDPVKGAKFLMDNWDYAAKGTDEFAQSTVQYHVSAAVYLPNGEIACVAFCAPYGNICCLVTHREHRRKGYASAVIRYIYRELGRRGFHVCLETAPTNNAGLGLHTSINQNIIARVEYICHNAL